MSNDDVERIPLTRLRATVAIVVVLSTLSYGCTNLPVVPNPSREEVFKRADDIQDTSVNLATAKKLLSGWRNVYQDAADSRRSWQLGFGEALFYGSLFAVLGPLSGNDRLRNVGITMAAGSGLVGAHYQLDVQISAFRKAIRRLSCIEEAVLQINPADAEKYRSGLDETQGTTLTELPTYIFNRVGKIRRELGDAINGIQLSAPSRDQIAAAFKSWLDAKATPAAGEKAGLAEPITDERQLAFLAALNKVKPEIEICMSEGGT